MKIQLLTILMALGLVVSCRTVSVNKNELNTRSDTTVLNLDGVWKYSGEYYFPEGQKTGYFSHLDISNDTVLFVFQNQTLYSITFPYYVEFASKYEIKKDSLTFRNEKKETLTKHFLCTQDSLIFIRASEKGTYYDIYLRTSIEKNRLESLIQKGVDWSFSERKWIVNGHEYLNEKGLFSGSDHRVPKYLDLSKKNKSSYSYSKDTLRYSELDTSYVFTFSGIWTPGGEWSEYSLRLNILTNNGPHVCFYKDYEEEKRK